MFRPMSRLPFDLDRPLVFFDLETTGRRPTHDRIVEMATVRLDPGGGRDEREHRFNPEMPIPKEATDVHGISDEDVADKAPFRKRAKSLAEFLEGCDLGGFNIRRFDLPMLLAEFRRAGVPFEVGDRRLVDAQVVYHRSEPRDLSAAARFYLNRDHDGAHKALDDARATVDVMIAQLERYDLPDSIKGLHDWCDEYSPFQSEFDRWFSKTPASGTSPGGALVFRRGKHRGTPLDEVARTAPDYLEWMLGVDDMDPEVVAAARDALGRHDPNQTVLDLPQPPEPAP